MERRPDESDDWEGYHLEDMDHHRLEHPSLPELLLLLLNDLLVVVAEGMLLPCKSNLWTG